MDPNCVLTLSVEPFLPSILSHSATPSTYPPYRQKAFLPVLLVIMYTLPTADAIFRSTVLATAAVLEHKAVSLGQDVSLLMPDIVKYGNYANAKTNVAQNIFGSSLSKLRSVKQKYDPKGVMTLTGRWKV